ncbi:hypothetical protein LTR56_001110 [Elasticomyces elasticus]|nr:hypothetical protein LTR56_001110 [Elasticomyces elasticus]KAK3663510.1 hypothetical protein LTR22_005682 [Elasticomyces elasticus]KAK4927104.1 hypothetical protein LTR49_006019 [Elasticomyces elasticus]KAK5769031.1 hypothetical protein LTS12_000745 [Elasticomyces elasticus]
MQTTASTHTPTGFFDLPPEVRNSIYDYALVPANGIRPLDPTAEVPNTALLAASPLIKAEAEKMYWESNRVVFELSNRDVLAGAPAAAEWLLAAGSEKIAKLSSLTITRGARFSMELCHGLYNGNTPGLVLHNLHLAPAHWDLYAEPDLDLASHFGHNLVGGLAQFLAPLDSRCSWDYDCSKYNALQAIMGNACLGWARWDPGPIKFYNKEYLHPQRLEEERITKEMEGDEGPEP